MVVSSLVKWPKQADDDLHLFSTKFKHACSCVSTLPYNFTVWCLITLRENWLSIVL